MLSTVKLSVATTTRSAMFPSQSFARKMVIMARHEGSMRVLGAVFTSPELNAGKIEKVTMTKRMDWSNAVKDDKRKTSVSDEAERHKGDRAARWLDKAVLRDWEKLERQIEESKTR